MRSYLSKSEFFRKMKKKPALQQIIDNISSYTKEDITNLSGNHLPQWIKDELIKLIDTADQFKKRGNKTPEQVAIELAEIMTRESKRAK